SLHAPSRAAWWSLRPRRARDPRAPRRSALAHWPARAPHPPTGERPEAVSPVPPATLAHHAHLAHALLLEALELLQAAGALLRLLSSERVTHLGRRGRRLRLRRLRRRLSIVAHLLLRRLRLRLGRLGLRRLIGLRLRTRWPLHLAQHPFEVVAGVLVARIALDRRAQVAERGLVVLALGLEGAEVVGRGLSRLPGRRGGVAQHRLGELGLARARARRGQVDAHVRGLATRQPPRVQRFG